MTTTEVQLARMVQSLRAVFWAQVQQLASAASVDGVLHGDRLDRLQLPSYELAFAAAELLAVETALRRPAAGAESAMGERSAVARSELASAARAHVLGGTVS